MAVVASNEAVARNFPHGLHAKLLIVLVCPSSRTAEHFHELRDDVAAPAGDQMRTVLSPEQLASVEPSGDHARDQQRSE